MTGATGGTGGVIVEGIEKAFGGVSALRGIDFVAEPGEILGLLGPNGAGKTTTVDILSTLLAPDGGRAAVAGHDVVREAAAVRRSIMLTGQFAALDGMLSGYENLVLFGRLQGLSKRDARARADELLETVELTEVGARRVGTYSGGMRRRIDIACGLVVRPEVVFLDEPTTGLDPRSRQGVWELVRTFRDDGITTLLTTQYLEEADALCDRIVVIDHGAVVAEGTADELKARTGSSYCEIVPLHAQELEIMQAVLEQIAPQRHSASCTETDRLTVPAPDGAKTVAEVLRLLDGAGIELADIALRRPSLDDVFLSLTASPGKHAAPEPGAARKKVHP
ncbi:daunorubicin/doxorubicin resistance ABC transporter ATP-binding protein DrrA [Nocardia yamanashiensis]|uniref:daunorubicin/doxorubicin resistance ABC transporter ATP-binding protein DrrA n=1 Tax=Nocardia yamanashiensis TaxID=209247 RepID=UPI00082E12AE|nr:daunorubicin/doxorubicin resistance ABC transporter ATP-binding protein DrrA [Nocardia yamanashiensis]